MIPPIGLRRFSKMGSWSASGIDRGCRLSWSPRQFDAFDQRARVARHETGGWLFVSWRPNPIGPKPVLMDHALTRTSASRLARVGIRPTCLAISSDGVSLRGRAVCLLSAPRQRPGSPFQRTTPTQWRARRETEVCGTPTVGARPWARLVGGSPEKATSGALVDAVDSRFCWAHSLEVSRKPASPRWGARRIWSFRKGSSAGWSTKAAKPCTPLTAPTEMTATAGPPYAPRQLFVRSSRVTKSR